MICYHGSDTIVDLPKILDAKRPHLSAIKFCFIQKNHSNI